MSDAPVTAVFPDLDALVAEAMEKHGSPDSIRVSRVPKTDVYVLYGIYEAPKTVAVFHIRTYQERTN